jgi:hypothetical protein
LDFQACRYFKGDCFGKFLHLILPPSFDKLVVKSGSPGNIALQAPLSEAPPGDRLPFLFRKEKI